MTVSLSLSVLLKKIQTDLYSYKPCVAFFDHQSDNSRRHLDLEQTDLYSFAMPSAKRDQLVETALELFSREGFHATGIDRILAESGVAKMTLYNHFRSKDELILAALRLRDERFRNGFMQNVERRSSDPGERLLVAFDVLGDWLREQGFCGCMFINASAEFPGHDDRIHAAAAEHKRLMDDYLCQLATAAGYDEPETIAEQLGLLLEGAIVKAQVTGDCEAASQARRAAEVLLGHHQRS
jgi:AcrR family transcriptional regulator